MPFSKRAGLVLWFTGVLLLLLIFGFFHFNHGRIKIDRPPPLGCEVNASTFDDSEFNPWRKGIVTTLQPAIPRNCNKLFEGDHTEVSVVRSELKLWKNSLADSQVLQLTSNCSWVEENFINNLYTTKLELLFPIAFVFVVYNSPQQVMRLLKLLYRPHNQYCISPDKKSGPLFIGIFRNLAKCLDNVHLVSTLREVKWGHPSIMESQMCCYKDLMNIRDKQAKKDKWKYVINLCGKELPLATNHEMVSHLVNLNGTSMVEAELVKGSDHESLRRLWDKKPVPYSIPYAKGNGYMSLSQEFIHFILTNSTAINVYKFFQKSWIPEEHYFATLYMLPGVPGGVNHSLEKNHLFATDRYCWAYNLREKRGRNCHGKVVHNVCIVDIGDLSWIDTGCIQGRYALFHNKYFMENDHVVMDCMEERIIARNKLEHAQDSRCGYV